MLARFRQEVATDADGRHAGWARDQRGREAQNGGTNYSFRKAPNADERPGITFTSLLGPSEQLGHRRIAAGAGTRLGVGRDQAIYRRISSRHFPVNGTSMPKATIELLCWAVVEFRSRKQGVQEPRRYDA
jgi:hypothetical protein